MTSPVETLREAARLMRERASNSEVPNTRWHVEDDGDQWNVLAPDPEASIYPWDVARDLPDEAVAEHIASWHPAVALAVADWLEDEADFAVRVKTDYGDDNGDIPAPLALAVAGAYLGEQP